VKDYGEISSALRERYWKFRYNSFLVISQAKKLGFFSYQLFNERPAKPVRASRVVTCFLFPQTV